MGLRAIRGVQATVSFLVAGAAAAQFPQYIAPGSLGIPTVAPRTSLEKSVGNAPWKAGPFRLQPYVVLRDLGYVDNLFPSGARVSDVTATGGLGVKAYLPLGSKVTVAAHVLPEYVWWRHFEQLRGWRHRAGVGVFAYFNRLSMELNYTDNDLLQYVSHEFDSPADITKNRLEFSGQVDFAGPFSLFAGASRDDWSYDDNGFGFAFPDRIEVLDRSEETWRTGVRYTRRSGFALGFGYEENRVDFEQSRRDRSSEGEGYVVTVTHEGARLSIGADMVRREIRETEGSQFRRFKAWTGGGRLSLRGQGRFGASLFGNRQVVYSLAQGTSYFVNQRLGASLDGRLGWRTNVRLFAERGDDQYEPVRGSTVVRIDDFDTIGAELQLKLRETSTFLAGFARTQYDSNQNAFDRELTTFRATLNLGGGFMGW
jgi:hypothetical protein